MWVLMRPWLPPSRWRRMAAPAPSPKSTQVLRSVQSVIVRQLLRADHEHGVVGVAGDELLRDLDREKEAGAGRRDVEAGGSLAPILVWMKQAVAGKTMSGRGGRDQDEIDLVAGDAGLLHRGEGGLRAHVAGIFVVRRDPAFLDPGASGDPLVVGLDDLREIVVRQDPLRHVTAGADDRDSASRFSGARARAGRSFHYNGGLPRRYVD